MKIYAPSYYKEFKCIADKCKNSCCIGLEIDIDRATAGKYSALSEGYGRVVKESVTKEGGGTHFILGRGDKCPHLNENGLCRIIEELGEGYLCNICREHPRFYNNTPRGLEAGLGMSCEEACRIILSSDGYDEFIELGECEGEAEESFIDPLARRQEFFDILKSDLSHEDKLKRISESARASLSIHTDREWRRIIHSLEYLKTSHKPLFSSFSQDPSTPKHHEAVLQRILAYLIYRHVSCAEAEPEIRCAVGFALVCERLLCSILKKNGDISATEAARIISEELEYSEDNTDTLMMEFLF